MSVNLIDALSVVVLILGWSLALSVYPRLPEMVPVHFGLRGEADRWGGRWMIFMIPLVSTAIVALEYWIFEYVSPGSPRPIPTEMRTPLIAVFATCGWMFVFGRGH
jgi:hypothetical protein